MTSSKLGTDTQTGETVYLHKASRRQGTYFIAATGVGKSTSLRYLIEQDIKQGIGVCVLDPHGDLINDVIGSLHRREDRERVLLLDAQDKYRKFGINLYQCDDPTDDELVTNTYDRVEHIFKLVWGEDIAHMPLVMQGIQNSAYTFIDSSPAYNCTMLEIPMLFRENTPRTHMVRHLRDDNIQSWWKYYNDSPQGTKDELARMVVNKVEGFTTNRLLRPIIGQSRSTIDFRQVIDSVDGKIVLIKMFGNNEKLTQLIGSLVIAQLLGAALSREDKARDERRQFHIYADEFELYATDDFTRLLKECRKYGMGVTLAHQSREDISNRNKAASLQVANIIVGRVIPDDANDIAGMFDTTPGTVETRYEYIRTPTHKPVDFIVSGKSHPSEVVNTVLGKWKGFVERANEPIRDIRIPAGIGRWGRQEYDFVSNEPRIRQAQYEMQTINDLFYQIMLEKNPHQVVPIALVYWMAKTFGLPFFDFHQLRRSQQILEEFEEQKKEEKPLFWDFNQDCIFLFCSGNCGKKHYCYSPRCQQLHWLPDGSPAPTPYKPCIHGKEFNRTPGKFSLTHSPRDYISFLFKTFAWGEIREPTEQEIKLYISLWIVDESNLEQTLALYEQHVRSLLALDLRHALEVFQDRVRIPPVTEGLPFVDEEEKWKYEWQWGHEWTLDQPDPLHLRGAGLSEILECKEEFGLSWLELDYTQLRWQRRVTAEHTMQHVVSSRISRKKYIPEKDKKRLLDDVTTIVHEWEWYIVPGQDAFWKNAEPLLQQEINRIITEQKPAFETFVRQLRQVMQALATQPIEDISGVVEEKPGTQRTYQDMQNEIASKLVKQPVGVAWCRVQNATGELEEHVIQLATSTTRLAETNEVQKWIEEIKERMLNTDGCLRSITDVEEEISARHALLRLPPKPPEPPLLPPYKPDEPPGSPRRKKIA